MSDWPPSLKPIGKFMARSREVEAEEPVVAYYCSYYSLTKAIELRDSSDQAANRFVTGLLEKCENLKKTLPPDNGSHREILKDFSLRVFDRADNEDRADRATKATARTFYAAMCFLEVCSVFGPLPHDLDERLRYAKWKAADITKALREGRRPIPGAPGEAEARAQAEEAEEDSRGEAVASDTPAIPPAPPVEEYDTSHQKPQERYPPAPKYPSSEAPSPLKQTEPRYPSLDIAAPQRNHMPTPPSLELPGHHMPPALAIPSVGSSAAPFDPKSLQSVNAKVEPYARPDASHPQPADQTLPDMPQVPPIDPILPVYPIAPVHPVAPVHPPNMPPPLSQPMPYSAPQLVHPPMMPPPLSLPVSQPMPVPPPQAPLQQAIPHARLVKLHYKPSVKQTQEAQRLAKYAASALDFQDVKTAISNLEQALHLLQGQRDK